MKKTKDRLGEGEEQSESSKPVDVAQLSTRKSSLSKPLKWKSLVAITIVILGFLLNWEWLWGLFFIVWAVHDLIRGTTYFVEPVERSLNPAIFYTIVMLWIIFGVLMLIPPSYYGY